VTEESPGYTAGGKKQSPDRLASMYRNIENSRATGRREGIEACLRFLSVSGATTVPEAMEELDHEMVRRLWIPPKDERSS